MPTDALTVLDRAVSALEGEERPGQRQLAAAVAEAITVGRHLVAEAPTGSGKSLAYLAPLVASGANAVVATATLGLQDQLWRKDLPLVREHADRTLSVALLKGRAQYLCRARLQVASSGEALFDERPGDDFETALPQLLRFADTSSTGDVADLSHGVHPATWRAVSCGPNECPGASRCDAGDECFAEHARMQADGADIIVVNHALYCAHLAAGGSLLPHHDVVVFDEAHALEATATKALGFDVSAPGLRQLAGRLRRAGVAGEDTDGLVASADALDRVLEELDGRVDPTEPRLAGVLASVAERIAALTRHVNRESGGVAAAHAAQLAGARLDAIRRLQVPAEGEVAWVDGDVRPVLRLAPIVVGPRLGPALFEQVTAVLVSATLGSGLRFEPLARRLGLDPDATSGPRAYAALRADSPFDFRRQAMLYVPRAIPDPRRNGWEEAAATELCALVAAAGGRALVLCTSRRAVDRLAACLREETDHVVLAQGDEANAQLAARFTDDETSCLVATRAFWVGLDVPGPACVLVVIDRLPFARPDDPLEQARREAAEQSGGSGFRDVDLPSAALVLAQGTGRLVRRRDDRGVVAVLDPRLATAGYRSVLLDALPPMRRVVDRATVVEFLGQAVG